MQQIFRLKFSYKAENEAGEIKKMKTEVFAECLNYTDAEKTALEIIDTNSLSKYEECVYEIVKTKNTVQDFVYNDVIGWDGTLVNNLIEHFFSNENEGFFVTTVKFLATDDEKATKVSYIVPHTSINGAIKFLKDYLASRGNRSDSFVVIDSKLDNCESLYLNADTHKSFVNESEN